MKLYAGKDGFTLLELLVTIVVIGILALLLTTAVSRAKRRGQIAGCTSNLRQIGVALIMFADEHNNIFPPIEDNFELLYPNYIDDLNTFACPGTKTKITDRGQLAAALDPVNGITVGMDYEYRGTAIVGGDPDPEIPTLRAAERHPTRYLLAWDNDNYGINRVIDNGDNHGAVGGNKLFSDGSVRWFRAGEWGFGD